MDFSVLRDQLRGGVDPEFCTFSLPFATFFAKFRASRGEGTTPTAPPLPTPNYLLHLDPLSLSLSPHCPLPPIFLHPTPESCSLLTSPYVCSAQTMRKVHPGFIDLSRRPAIVRPPPPLRQSRRVQCSHVTVSQGRGSISAAGHSRPFLPRTSGSLTNIIFY